MEDFLSAGGKAEFGKKSNEWYRSSVLIAKLIVNKLTDIDKDFGISSPNFQDIYYFRGDKKIMGNIFELYKIANKNTDWMKLTREVEFGDVNKWNPADMYLATERGKNNAVTALENELREARKGDGKQYTFLELNKLVSDLIDSGDLLPLSLKKGVNNVHLVKVNWDSGIKSALLKRIRFSHYLHGTERNKWTDYKKIKTDKYGIPIQQSSTRDFKMILMLPDECTIKLRHDPSSGRNGAFKIEVIGGSARGGSIASIAIFSQLFRFVDKQFGNQFENAYNNGVKAFVKEMDKKQFYKGQKGRAGVEKAGAASQGGKGVPKAAAKAFNHARGEVSALTLVNTSMSMLSKWFDKTNQAKKNKLARHFYQYITSRSAQSGKFVIAK